MSTHPQAPPQARCPGCGGELAPGFLECPLCHRLVHGAELARLASVARQAEQAGDRTTALGTWRKAVELLPQGTSQRKTIDAEMRRLGSALDGRAGRAAAGAGAADGKGKRAGALAGLGAIGAMVLANGKLLLVGLVKLPTLLSMFAYASFMGGRGLGVSLGVIAAIYVHEVGHVATLRRYGIEASAPMFIPGFGALVRMKQYPTDAHEEARTGLAGPLWGLSASIAALLIGLVTGSHSALLVAWWSAKLNTFNLLPVWQLDGARGLKALSRKERFVLGAIAVVAAVVFVRPGAGDDVVHVLGRWMTGIVGVVILARAAFMEGHPEGDRRMLLLFASLVVLHPAVAWLADALGTG